MRCATCRQITLAHLRSVNGFVQQPSFPALKSSAESGCDLCKLSYSAVKSTIEFLEDIESLERGHQPEFPNNHNTKIRLEETFVGQIGPAWWSESIVWIRVGGLAYVDRFDPYLRICANLGLYFAYLL